MQPDLLASSTELLTTIYTYLDIGALAGGRMMGLMMVMPLFTRMGMTGLIQTCVAVALAAPVVPTLVHVVPPDGFGLLTVIAMGAKEIMVGFILGTLFGIPIWAAETAGEVLDLQRGSSAAQLFDPAFVSQLNITGTFLSIVMVALFFASGGFLMMLGGVYDSYKIWPIDHYLPLLSDAAPLVLLGLMDKVMSMAVVLCAPILIAMFVADISLGLVSRAAQNLHVFDMSLAFKNLIFVISMLIYCVFLIQYMGGNMSFLLEIPRLTESLAPPLPEPAP
jgi:type III secretion protein T